MIDRRDILVGSATALAASLVTQSTLTFAQPVTVPVRKAAFLSDLGAASTMRSRDQARRHFCTWPRQQSPDVVEVDDHQIRIKGSKDVLERAVLAENAAEKPGSQMSTRWRARQDSNL
jgi:hypothetical protein